MRCGSVGRERERESNSYKEYSRWGKEREETSWEMRETKKKRIMKKRSHEKWRDEKKPQKNSESSLKRDKNNP